MDNERRYTLDEIEINKHEIEKRKRIKKISINGVTYTLIIILVSFMAVILQFLLKMVVNISNFSIKIMPLLPERDLYWSLLLCIAVAVYTANVFLRYIIISINSILRLRKKLIKKI